MDTDLLAKANNIRRGAAVDPEEGFDIARKLAIRQHFDAACRLARYLRDTDNVTACNAVELRQKLALWTSKNSDAPDDTKHDEALAILDGIKLTAGGKSLANTTDPETLGIAGGICKRQWLVTGRQADLELSLGFYERGAAQGIASDNGYTAVNAAFVIDLLAHIDSVAGIARKPEATAIRQQVLETLLAIKSESAWEGGPPHDHLQWFNETIAEAYFGLVDYENATTYLKRAYEVGRPEPWELETTDGATVRVARAYPGTGGCHDRGFRSFNRLEGTARCLW